MNEVAAHDILRAAITAPAQVSRLNESGRALLKEALAAQTRREERVAMGYSYDREFILGHPIAAACCKCGYLWRGADAIRAPNLRNVCCFFCGSRLAALDQEAYADRLRTLHLHRVGEAFEPEDEPTQLAFDFLAA